MQSRNCLSTITLILFLTTCVAATVNTGLFVYPSLSRSLLMECGLLLLAFVAFLHCLFARRVFSLHSSLFTKFIVLWVAYIVVHGRLSEVTELYRTVYLCVTLLSVISLSYCLRAGLLTKEGIYHGLLIIAVIHLFCVFAQWLGFMEPENSLYPVTGACDNPNVTAMYIVGCLPLMVLRLFRYERKVFYGVLVFLSFICLVILRCRTAYIGLCVELVVFFLFPTDNADGHRFLCHLSKSIKSVGGFVFVLFFIVIASIKMYQMKQDSADGRLLIWKVSAQMVTERPMGCGYGLFPKHYNLRQAEYFHEEHGSEKERRNASFVYMAYDDFLEHGAEGGVIGMLFLIGFYSLIIRKAIKARRFSSAKSIEESENRLEKKSVILNSRIRELEKSSKILKFGNKERDRNGIEGKISIASILIVFSVMSLVNFVVAGIQTWLLVICCAAMVAADGRGRTGEPEETVGGHSLLLHRMVGVAFIVLVLMLSVITVRMTYAQYRLGGIKEKMSAGEAVDDSEFVDIEDCAYSSEAFWRLRARNLMRTGDYGQATLCINNAMRYTAAPDLLYMAHRCLSELGREADGIGYINEVYHTQPTLLLPKLILMRFNDSRGDTVTAMKYANEIVNTEAKVSDGKTAAIVREAEIYLERK